MVWDKATPAGTDPISQGDDVIRELKTDLENAFRGQSADGTEAKFPGSDTANPIFRYRGRKGTTGSRPAAGQYGLYFDTTRNALQRDNGSSWDDIGTVIPSGTKMIFFQASAPVGWTKDTTYNDYCLRVVTGSGGGTGGSQAFTSALAGNTGNENATHTHTLADEGSPVAAQNLPWFSGYVGSDSAIRVPDGQLGGSTIQPLQRHTGTESANHAHTTFATQPYYLDVIVCTKD